MKKLYEPSPEAAAKKYARLVGDHGHEGGWIHSRSGQRIVQGWDAYAQRLLRHQKVIVAKEINGETRWAIVWHRGRPTGLPMTCDSDVHRRTYPEGFRRYL